MKVKTTLLVTATCLSATPAIASDRLSAPAAEARSRGSTSARSGQGVQFFLQTGLPTQAPPAGQLDPSPAQTAPAEELPPTPPRSEDQGDPADIVVTGIRASYATATETKRRAVGITDGISLDGIGRFPDLNLGEALQRVVGVQINREAERRDATINLRGLPSVFARQTLNGQAFAEPFLEGTSPLGIYESDVFSAVQIIKSPSAADQPGGLSGNVDYRLARALSREDGAYSVRLGGAYEELADAFVPNAGASFSKHFLDHRLGVYAIGAYSRQNFRRDSISFNQYTPLSRTTTPDYAARYGTTDVYFPSQIRQFVRNTEGDRYSVTAGAEFAATEQLSFALNGLYTRRSLDKASLNLFLLDFRNAATVINPTGETFEAPTGRTYIDAYDARNYITEVNTRFDPVVNDSFVLNGDVTLKNEDWRAVTTIVYTKGTTELDETQFGVNELAAVTGSNGLTASVASGGRDISDYSVVTGPDPFPLLSSGPYVQIGPNALQIPGSTTVFQGFGTQAVVENEVWSSQSDVERYVDWGLLHSIQSGIRFERSTFTSAQTRLTMTGVNTGGIGPDFVSGDSPAPGFFNGQASGYSANWVAFRTSDIDQALRPITVPAGALLTRNGYVNDLGDGGARGQNYGVERDIVSGYGMLNLDGDLFGIRLRGAAGLRYERTENEIVADQFNANREVTLTRVNQNYDDWLPSILLATDITDRLTLRGAYYETFVRPQPRQLAPVNLISGSGAAYNVTLGNTTLRPYQAQSFDASLEFYNRPGNVISLAVFSKRVIGLIAPEQDPLRRCPADGGGFGFGPLTLTGDVCESLQLFNGQRIRITTSGNTNSANPITVRGVEFQIQQDLKFLPAPFDDLGTVANYSYTDVSGTDVSGNDAVLPGVSDHVFNLVGYYETDKFGIRLAYNYRTKYDLQDGGTFSGGARSVKARGQLDASASLRVTPNISITTEVFNITDARRVEYESDERVPRRTDVEGRVVQAGVRVAF